MSLFKTMEDEDWLTLQMFRSPQTGIVSLEGAQVWANAFKHFRLPHQTWQQQVLYLPYQRHCFFTTSTLH
jgi:hypothetical protein